MRQPSDGIAYRCRPLGAIDYGKLLSRPGWAAARTPVAPGIELRGLIRRPQSDGALWVLLYPGNDAAQLRTGQDFLERLAGAHHWGLAVFAYRGFDSSEGTANEKDLAADAPAILARVCMLAGASPARVHLVGTSIGRHCAIHASRAATAQGQPAASLSLLAGVSDSAVPSTGEDHQMRSLLAEVPEPVMLLQASEMEPALQSVREFVIRQQDLSRGLAK